MESNKDVEMKADDAPVEKKEVKESTDSFYGTL